MIPLVAFPVNMFKYRQLPIFILAVLLLLVSCSCIDEKKIQATGKLQDIVLIGADLLDTGNINALKEEIEQNIRWVIDEKIFTLKPVSAADFDLFRMRKNIVIAGIPGISKSMAPLWSGFLDGEAAERYSRNGKVAFFIEDYWSQGQTVYFFAGINSSLLTDIIQEKGEDAFVLFEHRLENRMFGRIYIGGMNAKENKRIIRKYPWRLVLPTGYRLRFEENKEASDIIGWWRRDPDLQIFVYSEEYAYKRQSIIEMIELRNSLASRFYDMDFIVEESVRTENEKFGDFDAISIAGAWENRKYMVGGCFKSILFHEYASNPPRLYLIDLAVFAPGEEKDPLMRRLGKIVESFRLENDFSAKSL